MSGLLRIGRRGEQEFPDLAETPAVAGGDEAVEADLEKARGEHALEKAMHDLLSAYTRFLRSQVLASKM
jgi:hypothetical protein